MLDLQSVGNGTRCYMTWAYGLQCLPEEFALNRLHLYAHVHFNVQTTLHALTLVLASTQFPGGKPSLDHRLTSMAKRDNWSAYVCSAFVPARWLMPMAPPVPLPPHP